MNIYYWRQSVVFSAILLQCLSAGITLGFTAALSPVLLSSNTTNIIATHDQVSWLSASLGIFSIIGYIILPAIMEVYGRKTIHLIINIIQFIGWIIFYFADSLIVLFIGRFFQGLGIAVMPINGVLVSEYSSPVLRGYYMTVKTMLMAIGVMFCHASIIFWSWRQVALASAVCSMLALLMTLIWPESPAYLALKGRFSECEKSFIWLHGFSIRKNKELKELISAQTEELNNRGSTKKRTLQYFWKIFLKKELLKPVLICTLLTICIDTCGRYYLFIYVIQIINDLLGDTSMAVYYSIAGDCLTVFALLLAGPVIKYLKRRTVLLGIGSISVILIFCIPLATYTKSNFPIIQVTWLAPCLILAQLFIINLSLVPVCLTIMGEIFTLEFRSLGTCVVGLIFSLLYTVNIKLTSVFIMDVGVEGAYSLNGLFLFLSLLILYFIVPETKDRTLQDIEDEIKGIKRCIPEAQSFDVKVAI